ncbi:ShlB/FhaC/HecB family hemolysin secretion/activation protein, partial [Sedimenticola hydrogenitrophicus]|uniref:ShlB/FhaC/HecB family hemolysin secretion/activation protein n=1 Tax=Sedimenticola hydrogenitrophicus TaxID=2967975 RepID=UPI002FF8A63F
CAWLISFAAAADLSAPSALTREQLLQDQRQEALEARLQPQPADVRILSAAQTESIDFPSESPCFPVAAVVVEGGERRVVQRVETLRRQALGKCLGTRGIQLLMTRMQNRLIESGLITTRVLAPGQELSAGELRLVIVEGKVSDIRLAASSRRDINLGTLLPLSSQALLDLRDLEQGLENLQRLPGTEAGFQLLPGALPGESVVVVDWQQERPWRVALTLDDAGSQQTGKRQAGATLFLDNPLGLGDLFYLSGGMDVLNEGGRGSGSHQIHYSLPLGYWLLGMTADWYDYQQTVAGGVVDYRYRGESERYSIQLGRVFHRSDRARTAATLQISKRRSDNFIDDAEIALQHRKTAAWQLSLNHRQFFRQGTLSLELAYSRGTRWFNAEPAPEEAVGEGTALARIWSLNALYQLPVRSGGHAYRYQARVRGQWSDEPLTPQDRFSIGSRWHVRGFDGQWSLSADRGWSLSNEVAWRIPRRHQELYLGLDYGKVAGRGSELLPGTALAGAVLGMRGTLGRVGYELFAGAPLQKPAGFHTANRTFGFSLNWQI